MTLKKILYSSLAILCIFLIVIYLKLALESADNNVCEIQNISDLETVDFTNYKSVKLKASDAYESDFFKDILQGENYRAAWETTVEAPILYLDTLYGGVEILKSGGGKQTRSLKLQNNEGLLLTLRSVNKNPEPLVPELLKKLQLENVVVDGISAQHPYAALPVAKLAEATYITHTNPKLVFLPKQNILGDTYNTEFGNKIYLLEFENKGQINWSTYANVEFIIDNDGLQQLNSIEELNIIIDKRQLIRSRLFDIVIGDWDRHAKQWGWLMQKQDSTYKAIPFPTDRDNAFFNVEGLIPTLISNEEITPHLQSFTSDISMDGLVYDFDIYYLQGTTLQDFVSEAQFIQDHLTDDAIAEAFTVWNKTLIDLDAASIIKTIKTRRNNLINIARRFKKVLDSKPLLDQPLKGSEFKDTPDSSIKCFEC